MSANKPNFPPIWLPVVLNILLALVLAGSFLYLYIWGNVLTWQNKASPLWPIDSPILQLLLTGVGGVMAALFAVALNLRTSPLPRTPPELIQRMTSLLNVFPVRSVPPVTFIPLAFTLGQFGTDEFWRGVNRTALITVGVILTLAYLLLAVASIVSAIWFEKTAPGFISAFGKVSAGVLVGAFAAWVAGITKRQ